MFYDATGLTKRKNGEFNRCVALKPTVTANLSLLSWYIFVCSNELKQKRKK